MLRRACRAKNKRCRSFAQILLAIFVVYEGIRIACDHSLLNYLPLSLSILP